MTIQIIKLILGMWAGHAICDYSLQTDFIAIGKSPIAKVQIVPWYYIMAAHAASHGLMVYVFTGSLVCGLLEFVLHFVADVSKCLGYTNIHHDQMFHLVCKILWAIICV